MNITGKHRTASPQETIDLGSRIAQELKPGSVIALSGELGAGKTCLSQGIAKGLNVQQAVSSPTFTVINEYSADLPLNHIDLYRLNGPDEALAIGIEEYLFGDGVTLIEWPERCLDLLPAGFGITPVL